MKVLVEFDLTNSIHRDLFQQVRTTMSAHDNVDLVKPKLDTSDNNSECDVSPGELQALYLKALEVNSDAAKDELTALRGNYGDRLADWTTEARFYASQQFKKLADNVADRF